MLTGLRARRWCKSPKLLHMISLQEESLASCRTLPLPPLSSMHNLRYKNDFGKIKCRPCSPKLGLPMFLSLSNSGWVSIWSAEPAMLTNYAWASKIRPGRPQCLLSFRENGRTPAAYVSGANFLSWNFIGLPCKPSYSASFLHWISSLSYPFSASFLHWILLSYPHSITLYILN